jgi:redox-sensitive bicupin YhaK (pirin superfamily)
MSWQPAQDPTPGDRFSCDAIETVIVPRARDIGSFEVRRALPSSQRQMVGPFIFFDQMGPGRVSAGCRNGCAAASAHRPLGRHLLV